MPLIKIIQNILLLALIGFCISLKAGTKSDYSSAKKIQKTVRKIDINLYAGATEVSNQQYKWFLEALKASGKKEKLKKCGVDSLAWEKLSEDITTCFEYFYNYHSQESYDYYPVVNIRYQAAVAFCDWLTDVYNADEGRQFKKVELRLPTEEEWLKAAHEKEAPFAWGDSSLHDPKDGGARARLHFIDKSNLFLRNFPAIAAPVKSFIKYEYDLYNIHGNVSEMLSTEGKAKGGSWYDPPEKATLKQIQIYTGPDPRIGFRYFMIVLEE